MHTVAKSLLDTDAQPTMYEGVFDEGVSYRMIFDHMNGQYETQTGEWTYLNYSGWLLIQ